MTEASDRAWFGAEGDAWVEQLRAAGPVPVLRGADLAHGGLGPDVIDGHVLLRELGRGGQGVVFAAVQIATRREVAVKLLREGPLASPGAQRRFARETELAAALDHPGIVQVFEAGTTEAGRAYVVMELVGGQSWAQWGASMPSVRARVERAIELCAAIEHAHRRAVIHLDLKPSNLRITPSGRLKVLDFGLARCSDDASIETTITEAAGAGTPAYMAPEQAQGPRSTWDQRTDLHAIGVILFELLAGVRPYALEGSPYQVMEMIVRDRPARLAAVWDDDRVPGRLRRDLDVILETALNKDPEARYASADALGTDLRAALDGTTVWARRRERGYRARRALAEYAGPVAIAGVVMMGLLGATLFAFDLAKREAEARRDAVAAEAVASARLADVRRLANTFLHDLDPLIQHLPGALAARERIVAEGLEYLLAVRADAASDPELALEVAAAYTKLGLVQWDQHASHLGDAAGALASHRAACEVLGAIPQARRSDVRVALTVHRAWLVRSKAEQTLGDLPSANASLDRAEAALAQRAVGDGELLRERQAHAEIIAQRAALASAGGQRDKALELERAAHTRYAELAAEVPDSIPFQRDLAVGHARIAQLLIRREDLRGALSEYEAFRDAVEPLLARSSDVKYLQRDLGTAYEWIGRIRADLGDPDAAVGPLRKAATIIGRLAEVDGGLDIRMDLASVVNRLGEALLAAGDHTRALEAFGRFRSQAVSLRSEHPEVTRTHRLEAVAWYKLHEVTLAGAAGGTASQQAAARSEAIAFLERSHEIFLELGRDGRLAQGDAAVPETLAGAIAALREEAAEARRP